MAKRIFLYEDREYDDPDPNMTIDEVRQYYAQYMPELSNATTSSKKEGDNDVIEFKKRVGTKGKATSTEVEYCRLGFCMKEKLNYGGGGKYVWDKVGEGVCPVCGGPLEKREQLAPGIMVGKRPL